METQSMLVVPVGEEKEFNVYVSTQAPTFSQVHQDTLCSDSDVTLITKPRVSTISQMSQILQL